MSRFNYQRFYDCISPIYAVAMRLIPAWRRYARQALPWLPPGGRILEIGHGPGFLLEELSQQHVLGAGVDLSWGMIQRAQGRLRRAHLPIRLVQGDAAHLPFATESLDGVVMVFSLDAIPDGLAAVLEASRVLRSGGTLAVVEARTPADGQIIGTSLAKILALFGTLLRDEAELMQQAGLRVIEQREFGPFQSIRLVVGQKP